jgi:hypothetical protein
MRAQKNPRQFHLTARVSYADSKTNAGSFANMAGDPVARITQRLSQPEGSTEFGAFFYVLFSMMLL